MHGVAEVLEASDQTALGAGAVALIQVSGPEVDVWAVVLEEMPRYDQNGVTDGHGSLVSAAAWNESVVLRCQVGGANRSGR